VQDLVDQEDFLVVVVVEPTIPLNLVVVVV
jgi:hypothetical protein